MERASAGKIRKIQWGVVPNLPTKIIAIGSKGPDANYIICDIVEDKNTFFDLGYYEYLIYIAAEKDKKKTPILWQRFSKVPDMVEYSLDGASEVFI